VWEHMFGWHYTYGWGHMWLGGVLMILAVLLIAWGVWLLARGSGGQQDTPRREDSAMRILRERYARGGITKEEFDERKQHLQS
jgi:putative membrane protein